PQAPGPRDFRHAPTPAEANPSDAKDTCDRGRPALPVRVVLSGTSWTVGIGLAAGALLCLVFDKIASQGVTESSREPLIFNLVTALLLAVAFLACLGPGRRAASIDPIEAVRHE